jgi:large subunit ribosomal protein L28
MSIKCEITGIGCLFGHNVSHAKNRTKTRWLPNVRVMQLYSKKLGNVNLKISSKGLRTIEKHGGLDEFLLSTLDRKLTPVCVKLKQLLQA